MRLKFFRRQENSILNFNKNITYLTDQQRKRTDMAKAKKCTKTGHVFVPANKPFEVPDCAPQQGQRGRCKNGNCGATAYRYRNHPDAPIWSGWTLAT